MSRLHVFINAGLADGSIETEAAVCFAMDCLLETLPIDIIAKTTVLKPIESARATSVIAFVDLHFAS